MSNKPTKDHPQHWTKKINACGSNVKQCLGLLQDYKQAVQEKNVALADAPFVAAIAVCGKAKRYDVAINVYKECPSEATRTRAIATCGRCGRVSEALDLLHPLQQHKHESKPSIGSYNAAIAACAQNKAWKESLQVLESMPRDFVTTLSCNAVLTGLARSRRAKEARDLLERMKNPNDEAFPAPDRISHHNCIVAMIRGDSLEDAYELFGEMKQHTHLKPSQSTYDALITAYGKRDQWEQAHALQKELQDASTNGASSSQGVESFHHWYLPGMPKIGRGKGAYWQLGTYDTKDGKRLTVALQPHRNPAKNGISLLLLDDKGTKLGYLLMINSSNQSSSTLLGVFVDPKQRKSGLSKVFLALWMQLCLHAKLDPGTGIIHKPLLALVLQHSFQYTPQSNKGVEAEVSPGKGEDEGKIQLYSQSSKSLEGAFSPRDVKREGLVFATKSATPRGRLVRIGTIFSAPKDLTQFQKALNQVLFENTGEGKHDDKLCYNVPTTDLKKVLLGE